MNRNNKKCKPCYKTCDITLPSGSEPSCAKPQIDANICYECELARFEDKKGGSSFTTLSSQDDCRVKFKDYIEGDITLSWLSGENTMAIYIQYEQFNGNSKENNLYFGASLYLPFIGLILVGNSELSAERTTDILDIISSVSEMEPDYSDSTHDVLLEKEIFGLQSSTLISFENNCPLKHYQVNTAVAKQITEEIKIGVSHTEQSEESDKKNSTDASVSGKLGKLNVQAKGIFQEDLDTAYVGHVSFEINKNFKFYFEMNSVSENKVIGLQIEGLVPGMVTNIEQKFISNKSTDEYNRAFTSNNDVNEDHLTIRNNVCACKTFN